MVMVAKSANYDIITRGGLQMLCAGIWIMKWSQPRDINDWTKRLVGLRPFVLMLFVAIVLFSEFRFDWMEQMLGNALAKTNPDRPESGSI